MHFWSWASTSTKNQPKPKKMLVELETRGKDLFLRVMGANFYAEGAPTKLKGPPQPEAKIGEVVGDGNRLKCLDICTNLHRHACILQA